MLINSSFAISIYWVETWPIDQFLSSLSFSYCVWPLLTIWTASDVLRSNDNFYLLVYGVFNDTCNKQSMLSSYDMDLHLIVLQIILPFIYLIHGCLGFLYHLIYFRFKFSHMDFGCYACSSSTENNLRLLNLNLKFISYIFVHTLFQ